MTSFSELGKRNIPLAHTTRVKNELASKYNVEFVDMCDGLGYDQFNDEDFMKMGINLTSEDDEDNQYCYGCDVIGVFKKGVYNHKKYAYRIRELFEDIDYEKAPEPMYMIFQLIKGDLTELSVFKVGETFVCDYDDFTRIFDKATKLSW